MSYDSYERRSNSSFLTFIGIVLFCGFFVFLVAKYFTKPDKNGGTEDSSPEEEQEEVVRTIPREPVVPEAPEEVIEETSAEILESLGIGAVAADPALLVEQIGRNLEAGEVRAAANIIGRRALSEGQLERLHQLARDARFKLNMERPISEIGELEINRRARWALNLEEEDKRLYLDLARNERGWGVEKVTLPPAQRDGEIPRGILVDALGITDSFLHAALKQSFETAKSFVNSEEVSDAKIAGLCIIFEEGGYRLRVKKPLRAVFDRDNTAAFIANVETEDGSGAAQFGINVQRDSDTDPWRVTEINLDQLLADYAERVAGGDVYYTPLVRNPKGGDTLILYFGFDEDELTPRTERQLEIVALLLQTDPDKILTLSGHTDGIGSESYNKELSKRRAETVRTFLIDSGVNPEQVKTVALGKSSPRRPNTTETGEDDPDGRRANRRTEIYLDF